MNHITEHKETVPSPSLPGRFRGRLQGIGLLAAIALLIGFATLLAAPHASAGPDETAVPASTIRIGVYDSRAICIAYTRSDMHRARMSDLMAQRKQAETAGDAARLAELDKLGQSMQTRIHLQGFSTAPVDDILEFVRDELPHLARAQNVAVITRKADYYVEGVELVDVTDAMVELFNPDAVTRANIQHVIKREPEPIEKIAQMRANEF